LVAGWSDGVFGSNCTILADMRRKLFMGKVTDLKIPENGAETVHQLVDS
jgi:hypothetical protein